MSQVSDMYDMWLSGKSIRKIACYYNVDKMLVQKQLRAEYGKDACNLEMQGLARIAYQEYGDRDTALRAMNTEGLYMSEKTMNNHSKAYRNVKLFDNDKDGNSDTLYDYLQQEPEEYREGLLLPLYLWIARRILGTLADCVDIYSLYANNDQRTDNLLGGNQEAQTATSASY